MALETLGAKLLQEYAPRFRAVGAKKADNAAAQAAKLAPDVLLLNARARVPAASLKAANEALLGDLDRSAVEMIQKFNAEMRRTNPTALALKYKHMAKSPARFLTGEPDLMAYDLRNLAGSLGADTAVVGDKHMRNVGTVLNTKNQIRRRTNDFDEATIAPAPVDTDRMAVHIVLTLRGEDMGQRKTRALLENYAGSYYDTLAKIAESPTHKFKVKAPDVVKNEVKAAGKRDARHWLDNHAPVKHGQRVLPRDSGDTSVAPRTFAEVNKAFEGYRKSLPKGAADKLDGYRVTDVVSVLSGTGSMGETRFHVLLEGGKKSEPILLQLKAQEVPALDRFTTPKVTFRSHAERNVMLSELLDGGLDSFRGVARLPGSSEDLLVERLTPTHTSLEPYDIKGVGEFNDLLKFDGAQDAKAHARGAKVGLATAQDILKTLGSRDEFVQSTVDTAHAYADKTERDFAEFVSALKRDPLLAGRGSN